MSLRIFARLKGWSGYMINYTSQLQAVQDAELVMLFAGVYEGELLVDVPGRITLAYEGVPYLLGFRFHSDQDLLGSVALEPVFADLCLQKLGPDRLILLGERQSICVQ